MTIVFPRLRLTRAGIFILLAVLVAFLGAAAKHSQFEAPPHHGYLSKAVKMAGARLNPNIGSESAQYVTTPVAQISLDCSDEPAVLITAEACFTPVPLLSPPLRV